VLSLLAGVVDRAVKGLVCKTGVVDRAVKVGGESPPSAEGARELEKGKGDGARELCRLAPWVMKV
jgi:hypothetical protein